MGLHPSPDQHRDYYPLEQAAKMRNALADGETHVSAAERWTYTIEAHPNNAGLAAIRVFDETNKHVGYWYR